MLTEKKSKRGTINRAGELVGEKRGISKTLESKQINTKDTITPSCV